MTEKNKSAIKWACETNLLIHSNDFKIRDCRFLFVYLFSYQTYRIMTVIESLEFAHDIYSICKEIGSEIYFGEHKEDIKRAFNLFYAIDIDQDGNEEALQEVLSALKPITAADKSWVWALANSLRASCFYLLKNYKQARCYISDVLAIDEDKFTINKDRIKELKDAQLALLSACICQETLTRISVHDAEIENICNGIARILVEKLAYHNSFAGPIFSLSDFGAESREVPSILNRIEETFGVAFKDEILLGVSREYLEEDSEEKVEYNDIDIANLTATIYLAGIQDEDDENNSVDELSEVEQEYLQMYKEYTVDEKISERDRKMLNKMRDLMGISEERAKVIEGI